MSKTIIKSLYADGGVIRVNPSPIGGTYAYRLLNQDEQIVMCNSGLILPEKMGTETVTNNQTEMLAILESFEYIPDDSIITVYSDSNVSLGRLFRG